MDNFNWEIAINAYRDYLILERRMAKNSTEAYLRDMSHLHSYAQLEDIEPLSFTRSDAENFLASLHDKQLTRASIIRLMSGVRGFFNFLLHSDKIENSPFELIETPKMHRKLPSTLSFEDIEKIFDAIDLSTELGHRNRAIIEVLYGCGLRATELTELKLNDIFEIEGVLRVIGKGDKQRLTPISQTTLKYLKIYIEQRRTMTPKSGNGEIVFLNRRGAKLSRVMIFNIVRDSAKKANLATEVHPHTLRHSFATHLVEGGADIRSVQLMLGHQSITTTEIYTHISIGELRKAVERLRPADGAF